MGKAHDRGREKIVAHAEDVEDQEHARADARYTSLALRHIRPEHVGRALDHLAKSYAKAMGDGRMSAEELHGLSERDVDGHLANIARDNPRIAAPKPPPKRRSW